MQLANELRAGGEAVEEGDNDHLTNFSNHPTGEDIALILPSCEQECTGETSPILKKNPRNTEPQRA